MVRKKATTRRKSPARKKAAPKNPIKHWGSYTQGYKRGYNHGKRGV